MQVDLQTPGLYEGTIDGISGPMLRAALVRWRNGGYLQVLDRVWDRTGRMTQRLTDTDRRMLRIAYDEAKAGFDEGGCPIGSVLARGDAVVARGRNQRVQQGDPIAHGEMDALRKAGRQRTYRDTTLYTSLSPCMMCAGTIVQFGIPRVVIAENTTFGGNEEFLRSRGVEVVVANDPDCIALMTRFIAERPELWSEDIADT